MRARIVNVGVLLVAVGLSSAGCSFDDAAIDDSSESAGTTGGLPTTTDPELDSTSAAGGDESGSADDDTTDEPPVADPCDIDCGVGGFCEYDELGAPMCVCEPGYAAYGLRCLSCTTTNGSLDIDIPKVSVSATFLLNGQPFVSSFYNQGVIVLRDPATGDEVRLGDTVEGGTDSPVALLPGAYEVHYSRIAGGTLVPGNRSAMLETVTIPDVDSYELEIDVPSVTVSGLFLFNSEEPPTGQLENGSVVLVEPTTGDEIELGETRDGAYEAMVVPGIYEVHYRKRAADVEAPLNNDASFDELEIYLDNAGDAQFEDISVPVVILTGGVTLDGAAPPEEVFDNGQILLRDPDTNDEFVVGETRDGLYAVPVVAGEYDVVYRRLAGGDSVPVNTGAVLGSIDVPEGSQTRDVEITTAIIDGTLTIDGAPAPADPTNDAVIMLRNPQTGDEAILGNTASGTYSERVVQGTYDVYYRQQTSSGLVPVNTNARLGSVMVSGPTSHDVDVPVVTVNASVTVGGALPPDSAYDDGLLYLRDPQTGDSVLLGNTRLATLQRPVIPGTYELHYVVEAAGPVMPINAQSLLDTVEVGDATSIDVDIPVIDFQGVITVDGDDPPAGQYDRAVLLMQDVNTKDTIYLGSIETGFVGQLLTAGTYVLAYHALSSNGQVPANENAGLACIELIP